MGTAGKTAPRRGLTDGCQIPLFFEFGGVFPTASGVLSIPPLSSLRVSPQGEPGVGVGLKERSAPGLCARFLMMWHDRPTRATTKPYLSRARDEGGGRKRHASCAMHVSRQGLASNAIRRQGCAACLSSKPFVIASESSQRFRGVGT